MGARRADGFTPTREECRYERMLVRGLGGDARQRQCDREREVISLRAGGSGASIGWMRARRTGIEAVRDDLAENGLVEITGICVGEVLEEM